MLFSSSFSVTSLYRSSFALISSKRFAASSSDCWSFSSTGAIEGAYQIKTGKLVSLSEQQLLSNVTDNNGCGGGLMSTVYEYLI